ncbi:MAG: AAA family ATPase [Actinomycetota bacterium]
MEELLERDRELSSIDDLLRRGGVLVVEGGAGIGKTSILQAACRRAGDLGREVLRSRGAELETGFAFGVVQQLFERWLRAMNASERHTLLAGPAGAVRALVAGEPAESSPEDTAFAVIDGLYWLTLNAGERQPLLIAVDDAHWADDPSLRWLAYLAPRIEGPEVAVLVTLRPGEQASVQHPMQAIRHEAPIVIPSSLSPVAVSAMVPDEVRARAREEIATAVYEASGGNPFYVRELLHALERGEDPLPEGEAGTLMAGRHERVARRLLARILRLDQRALPLVQAVAVLGDGCDLRHAAAAAHLEMPDAARFAAELIRLEVFGIDEPLRFAHPIVHHAIESSLTADERDRAHNAAARSLHAEGAPPEQVAAHLLRVRPAGDPWLVERMREAARFALKSGAPGTAAELMDRALIEPPTPEHIVGVLREAARADEEAGRPSASERLERAMTSATGAAERAEIALELARTLDSVFRWVDAVGVLEHALAELGETAPELAARLEGKMVVYGVRDARTAGRLPPVLQRMANRSLEGAPAEAFATAASQAASYMGRPVEEVTAPLEAVLERAEGPVQDWDSRAGLLATLVVNERYQLVEETLSAMVEEVRRSGNSRALVVTYTLLCLVRLRLGALPDAESAARTALTVLRQSGFQAGLAFAATVLADVYVETGDTDEAQAMLDLLPPDDWAPGVATVQIPAARGRLRLAQGRPADALADFERCGSMWSKDVWGMPMLDRGYLHWRSGAALALLRLGEADRALAMAEMELEEHRQFGAHRALGVSLRVCGLARGPEQGLALLRESVDVLRASRAKLERAHSLTALGVALRRERARPEAHEMLLEALDLAARCGARPLVARVREELHVIGARPRRDWRTGLEALTTSELRVARLAADGRTNRQIAQELYITLKTVEGHLARAYGKLEITGRGELTGVLDPEKSRVGTP